MFTDMVELKALVLKYGVFTTILTGFIVGSYLTGRGAGFNSCRAQFEKGIEAAEDRVVEVVAEIEEAPDPVEAEVTVQREIIYRTDKEAVRKVAKLEGKIEILEKDLERAKNNIPDGTCSGPLPDEWVQQHATLDSVIQSVSGAERDGAVENRPVVDRDETLAGYPYSDGLPVIK